MTRTDRNEVFAALLTAAAVLVATGILRMITHGTFSPSWFWVVASGFITWAAPKLRRRLDAQDRRP